MSKKNKKYPNSIAHWPEDERPREKLFRSGEHTLTNTELLAILLRTGVKGQSAIDLARRILHKFKTFRNMSHTDIRDWKEFKGVGKAKIAQLKAAMEIARRFNSQEEKSKNVKIKSTSHVVDLFRSRMRDLKYEVVKIILCDAQNRMIDTIEIAQGTPTGSYPIVREIISMALQKFASGIICMHNHPFGRAEPSREDEIFTADLDKAGRLMDIKVLDHIIFGEDEFYSFDKNCTQEYKSI
jgi:DNA repair protein RadC